MEFLTHFFFLNSGKGVKGAVGEKEIGVGNRQMMKEMGVQIDPVLMDEMVKWEREGKTAM